MELKRMAGIGVFVIGKDFYVALFDDLNAPTPPEDYRHFWNDKIAESVLKSALANHMDKLKVEVACRRRGYKLKIPGLL